MLSPKTPSPDTLVPATPEFEELPPSIAAWPGLLAMIARRPVLLAFSALTLMLPALKLAVESRLPMALAVSLAGGADCHFRARVPLPVIGELLTVKAVVV